MKKYTELVEALLPNINEIFPWDLEEKLESNEDMLLVDIREPYEFDVMRIKGSINVPRGILESAADWGYDETVPELAEARDREVILMCRSGNRSVMAADVLQKMGYEQVYSLKTGLKGWNDFEQPLVDSEGNEVDIDTADEFFENKVRPEQMPPDKR
jgi:rhodanese-related sulfurtransferase